MLKKYFYQANLDPEIKIISSFSQEYYINKALDLAIKQFSEKYEKELIVLCDIFEKKSRSLDNLKENLLKAFNYCVCQKDYDQFLNNILMQYKNLNSPSCQYLNDYICSYIKSNIVPLSQIVADYSNFPKLYATINAYCSYLSQISNNNCLVENSNILNSCPACDLTKTERIAKDDFGYEQIKYYVGNLRKILGDTKFLHFLQDENYLNAISRHLKVLLNF